MPRRPQGSGPGARSRSGIDRRCASGRDTAEQETFAILQTIGITPSVDDVLEAVLHSLDQDKALDVTVINLHGKSSIADFMVIASGTSKRHMGSMADHLVEKSKAMGAPPVAVEGADSDDWVLIDAGDVIVHLFRPEVRQFYALERLWGGPVRVQPAAAHSGTGVFA